MLNSKKGVGKTSLLQRFAEQYFSGIFRCTVKPRSILLQNLGGHNAELSVTPRRIE